MNKKNILVKFIQISILFLFIILWQILSDKKIIDSFIFSSPKLILKTIINLYKTNNLFNHIFITLYEIIISFLLSILLGILIASLMWFFKLFAEIINPFLTMLNSLPKIAFGPIIIIWLGSSMNSIIIMSLLISTIVIIIDLYHAFINTDKNRIILLKSLNANKIQIYLKLILPYNISSIINSLKINLSMTFVGVIMGEFLVSKQGIGYLIIYGSQIFNLNIIMTGIIILGIMVTLLYYLITLYEKKNKKYI